MLGEISAGAGGDPGSDLAQATSIATAIHSRFGLGIHGPAWLGETDAIALRDPAFRGRIQRQIEGAEQRAGQILAANRALLEEMAEALARSRDMDAEEAEEWLARVCKDTPAASERATATEAGTPE